MVIVTDIQRFCLHDGPGIRTTVFLKGCNLRCPWCANPETNSPEIQQTTDKKGIQHTFGKSLLLSGLKKEILRDHVYYENGGGVTWSGGEPLLQFIKIEQLLSELQSLGINQCIETSLYAPIEGLKIAIKYIDNWYVDCKVIYDDITCFSTIRGDLETFKNNIDFLFRSIPRNKIIFRVPFVPNFTDGKENLDALVYLANKYLPYSVEIIKVHNLGKSKYEKMNLQTPQLGFINDKVLAELINKMRRCNISVKVLEI